jgi:hypothetical protein
MARVMNQASLARNRARSQVSGRVERLGSGASKLILAQIAPLRRSRR